jgi:FkbM family methyltransferase
VIGAISALKTLLPSNLLFVDVGASKGDFTASILGVFPDAKGLLFEPTSSGVVALGQRFHDNPRIHIFSCALSSEAGTAAFNRYEQSENNSLLDSLLHVPLSVESQVRIETFDDFVQNASTLSKIDLIKIDTQGTDLRVLQGAEKTIERHRPAILTETIYVPLYEGQDSYYAILDFMRSHEYHLAGIYESHQTSTGLVAYADLLFLPESVYSTFLSVHDLGPFICADPYYLLEKNENLNQVCQERLDLINRLQAAADERLKLINELSRFAQERLDLIQNLHGECDRLLKTTDERLHLINELTKTAEERLMTIQQLDAEVKRLSQLVQG